jgi:hypothetical protein
MIDHKHLYMLVFGITLLKPNYRYIITRLILAYIIHHAIIVYIYNMMKATDATTTTTTTATAT